MTTPHAPTSADAAPAGGATAAATPETWIDALQAIWHDLPGLVSDRVDLLALELRRAGRALAQIVALLMAAAILGVTAWLVLWASLAVGLVQLGLAWPWAVLLVMALNGLAAWVAIGRLRALLPLLQLPATRRHLTLRQPDGPQSHSAPPGLPAAQAHGPVDAATSQVV